MLGLQVCATTPSWEVKTFYRIKIVILKWVFCLHICYVPHACLMPMESRRCQSDPLEEAKVQVVRATLWMLKMESSPLECTVPHLHARSSL